MTKELELPELPEPAWPSPVARQPYYTADQMRAYAAATLAKTQEGMVNIPVPRWQDKHEEYGGIFSDIKCAQDEIDQLRMRLAGISQQKAPDGETEAHLGRVGDVDYVPGALDASSPTRVWLQIDTDGNNDIRDEPWPGSEHVTWHDESIGGLEIQYVRADLVSPQLPVGVPDAVDTRLRPLLSQWREQADEERASGGKSAIQFAEGLRYCATDLEFALAGIIEDSRGTTPQPDSAAPGGGGVEQMARELLQRLMDAPYGDTTAGNMICAEALFDRLEAAWLPVITAALRQPAQVVVEEPIFHLRGYGDVTKEELERLAVPQAAPVPAEGEGWIACADRMPEEGRLVVAYIPDGGYGENFTFEFWQDDCWQRHAEDYDHFVSVGGSGAAGPDCVCTGPGQDAPYTFWRYVDPPGNTPLQPAFNRDKIFRDAEFRAAAYSLMQLVEGPGCIRWEDGNGFRLKDTNEWCQFYVAVKNIQRFASAPPSQPAVELEEIRSLARHWRIQDSQIGQGSAGNKARRKCSDELIALIDGAKAGRVGKGECHG